MKSAVVTPRRLAAALWAHEARELQSGGTMPAFRTYADGEQEPCVFSEQPKAVRDWCLRKATEMLNRAASSRRRR